MAWKYIKNDVSNWQIHHIFLAVKFELELFSVLFFPEKLVRLVSWGALDWGYCFVVSSSIKHLKFRTCHSNLFEQFWRGKYEEVSVKIKGLHSPVLLISANADLSFPFIAAFQVPWKGWKGPECRGPFQRWVRIFELPEDRPGHLCMPITKEDFHPVNEKVRAPLFSWHCHRQPWE